MLEHVDLSVVTFPYHRAVVAESEDASLNTLVILAGRYADCFVRDVSVRKNVCEFAAHDNGGEIGDILLPLFESLVALVPW